MSMIERFLERPRLVLCTTVLFALAGWLSWFSMPRQEDPDFADRWALITVLFPGADAASIERLVVDPLEDHLVEVDGLLRISSTSSTGFCAVALELRGEITDVGSVWDEVEEAMDAARSEFPAGVIVPKLDAHRTDLAAVVLAVRGSAELDVLTEAAEQAKRELLGIRGVSRVDLVGDPGQQIFVEYDGRVAQRLQLTRANLVRQLASRNSNALGGAIRLGTKTANVEPNTEFRSVEELASSRVVLPSGNAVPLRIVARVREATREPASSRMRWDGEPAVGLSIVARPGAHYGKLGTDVRAKLDELRQRLAPLQLEVVAFAPEHVESRISGLSTSLVAGVAIVAVVLWIGMGLRMALVVAAVLPAVVLVSLSFFAMGGGGLHQMSIAGLVIALGMLVDNAIVVAEDVQRGLDAGDDATTAARASVRELQVPLGTATGTTLAAFLPMLLAPGPTTEWTRAIPIVVMLSVTVSYVAALVITPLLAGRFLKKRDTIRESMASVVGARIAALAVRSPKLVLTGTAVILLLTAVAAKSVGREFFPKADRAMVMMEVALPAGTHSSETLKLIEKVEAFVSEREDVASVASFVGRSAPHFYYNLATYDNTPHRGQIAIRTRAHQDNEAVMASLRQFAGEHLLEAEVVVRGLQQGPRLTAPIDVRLLGEDMVVLRQAAERVLGELKQIPGTVDERHNIAAAAPVIRVKVDDAAAAQRGLSRADVAAALAGETQGLAVGQYRADHDPTPIFVRSGAGENTSLEGLLDLKVPNQTGESTPLRQIADVDIVWRASELLRWNRRRSVNVLAELDGFHTYEEVLSTLEARLAAEPLPPGVDVELGGAAQGVNDANGGLVQTLPVGLAVLLFFLFLQFDSFRRVGIILTTVPFALTGIIPGMLLGGQPFGFMSLLGAMSLIGIVVNAAIVLLDDVERRRNHGAPVDDALVGAIRTRILPIALTTATTGAGLLPLALSPTSLWPPMAWPMISGLFASALLTLIVVPALYRVLFASPRGVPLATRTRVQRR